MVGWGGMAMAEIDIEGPGSTRAYILMGEERKHKENESQIIIR